MKRREAGKREARILGVQCKCCARTYDAVVEKNHVHSSRWRLITRESDDHIESFYLCPHCLSRRSGHEL